VFLFANTIDVEALGEHADRLASRRDELRAALGVGRDGLLVLAVGRLAPEKGLDLLVQAVGRSGIDGAVLVIAGEGPERRRLEEDARRAGVRLVLTGDLGWEQLVGTYVAADVFALLSTWEAWGVVVNEAAACGKPLVLSDQVGAAADLLRDGENGSLVPAGDVDAAAFALRALAADPDLRRAAGERSREIVREWGYEPSVASFVAAVRAAAGRPSADRLASSP
jgi:glycosyltransferase involved in cell wall biosynthesis